jgi:hypothetical protein
VAVTEPSPFRERTNRLEITDLLLISAKKVPESNLYTKDLVEVENV